MYSRSGAGRCRVVRVGAVVELSGPKPMSSRPGPDRCRVVWVGADVEPSWSVFRLSRLRPSSSQVRLYPYQNEFNVINKVNLI